MAVGKEVLFTYFSFPLSFELPWRRLNTLNIINYNTIKGNRLLSLQNGFVLQKKGFVDDWDDITEDVEGIMLNLIVFR